MASLIFWENLSAVTLCFIYTLVAFRFTQKMTLASCDSIDWDRTFVRSEWFSGLNGLLKADASKACDKLLNDRVANCLSFSLAREPDAILALAAKSLPQSSTKSKTWLKPAEIFSGISRTIKWLRLRSSTIFILKCVRETTSRFCCATLISCAISCMLLIG